MDDGPVEELAVDSTGALNPALVVAAGAEPRAQAGLKDASPRAGPQAARQTATSSAAASPQARTRPGSGRRPLPQRMAAGPRPMRLMPPRPSASRLSESSREAALNHGPSPVPVLSLEPTVRVGVRAAARRQPAARRAPSGSSMGDAGPSSGARAARSRALGRSAGSSARASVRKPASRLAPVPPCPAHSVRRRARA